MYKIIVRSVLVHKLVFPVLHTGRRALSPWKKEEDAEEEARAGNISGGPKAVVKLQPPGPSALPSQQHPHRLPRNVTRSSWSHRQALNLGMSLYKGRTLFI